MKSVRRRLGRHFFRKAIAYMLVWSLVMNTSVPIMLALGPGDVTGTFDQTLTPGAGVVLPAGPWGAHPIIDTEHGAIIDWSNFNTVAGETVEFRQYDVLGGTLSESSAVLNRISSGAVPTTFGGALVGNGCVFVVNPAGVIFSNGSTVNVSQLVVSGLGMTNGAFHDAVLLGNPMVFAGGAGNVESRAMINADRVYLVGKKIRNIGSILAPNGLIVLAAGDSVYFTQDGSDVVVEILEDPLDATPDIENRSLIAANKGSIVLAAGDTFSRAIRNVGNIVSGGGSVTARAARVINERDISVSSSTADAGSITLAGREEIQFGPYGAGAHSSTVADAGPNGNGGNIILETEGTITFPEDEYISARGGSVTGDGGSVKLTCEHFVIGGEIDASPKNPAYANGTLEIDPPAVAIKDGVNAGAPDTIYTNDIETLSNTGTNLIVRAGEITVRNLIDGIIGSRGDIELHGSGPDSAVTFEDPSDTISTIQGDIRLSAGTGGIVAGNLETGRVGYEPGQIVLKTENGGPITVNSLAIRKGRGTAVIDVDASGSLIVNGAVGVGMESHIRNMAAGSDAVAEVSLKSGDDMVLNGRVTARAYASLPGDSKAHISIQAGSNHGEAGDATINQDLVATALTEDGASDALVEVDTWGIIHWGPGAEATADGDNGEVHVGPPGTSGRESALDTDDDGEPGEDNDGDRAQIIINERNYIPDLEGMPDFVETHMGDAITVDVLANDEQATDAALDAGPAHGSLVQNPDGTFTYTPDVGYVGDDSFTYTAGNGTETTDPITVTITMTNTTPTATGEGHTAHMNNNVAGTINGGNVFDGDGDPLTLGLVDDVDHGTLTFNPVDGTFTYTPDTGYVGPDSFTFSVTDGQAGAAPAQAEVTITMTNTAPTATGEGHTAHMNNNVAGTINGGNVFDGDGDPFTLGLVDDVDHGTLTFNPADGTFTYTPDTGYVGPDSFTFSVTDGQAGAAPTQADVTITVTNDNLPQAINDEVTTITGNPVGGNVLANDFDPDGDLLTVVLDGTAPANGVVTLNNDGIFTYTPNPGYVGEDTFAYEVSDGQIGAETSTATVTICVEPNPVPSLSPVAPGLERRDVKYSGCPALVKWVAKELGIDEDVLDIWVTNVLAFSRDIQPFETYTRFRTAAVILKDSQGSRIAALSQVINEFASSTAPPTEEQMASIADAIASNAGADNHYGLADEYLKALAQYIGILNTEMGFSMDDAVRIVTTNYIRQLAERGKADVATYVTARLAEL